MADTCYIENFQPLLKRLLNQWINQQFSTPRGRKVYIWVSVLDQLVTYRHAPRPGTTRESRARSFPVAKVFSEISSLLGSPLDIRRSEENT